MTRAAQKPLPHGPLEALGDNLWSVEGDLPNMALKRRMTVVRREDGSLVVHSAIRLSDDDMNALDALGPVRWVLVPNRFHRSDAPAYRERYPEAAFLCPAGAAKHVAKVVDAGDYTSLESDGRLALEILEGVKEREGVLIVRDSDGVSLVFCDAFFNVTGGGLMLKLLGSSGGPKVTRLARIALVADRKALRAHLERLAATPGLTRLIPGHGDIIEGDPAGILSRVAATL